jgi:hypothetical protein
MSSPFMGVLGTGTGISQGTKCQESLADGEIERSNQSVNISKCFPPALAIRQHCCIKSNVTQCYSTVPVQRDAIGAT